MLIVILKLLPQFIMTIAISCEELRYRSPKEQIQSAIDAAMVRHSILPNKYLLSLLQADIGDHPPFASRGKFRQFHIQLMVNMRFRQSGR